MFLQSCYLNKPSQILTELEESGYTHITGSSEISVFLSELSHRSAVAEKITIGTSVLGRPIEALLISKEINWFKDGYSPKGKITVMLVASQHGTEPSGAEALLLISREIAKGKLKSYLEDINFIIIPNSNPDGRDLHRRVNGNGVNLSTNFIILSEPESRVIIDVLFRWRPEVILDVHESAVLKKKSLGKQGYLIDFEAQFESANNPNVDREIRNFCYKKLLPGIITSVKEKGLSAQRYIGEITDINQVISHGGLSLRNLRNMAGVMGIFSFLLENRLDPSTGTYPTPKNIRKRVAKQYLCISSFIKCLQGHYSEIIKLSRNSYNKGRFQKNKCPIYLFYNYIVDPKKPEISLMLRKLDTNEPVELSFNYHSIESKFFPLIMPMSYIVTNHQELIRGFLDLHHIKYEKIKSRYSTSIPVTIKKILGKEAVKKSKGQIYYDYIVEKYIKEYTIKKGDLIINLEQPTYKLIALFLEPQSLSSIFNYDRYSYLVEQNTDFFIYSIYKP